MHGAAAIGSGAAVSLSIAPLPRDIRVDADALARFACAFAEADDAAGTALQTMVKPDNACVYGIRLDQTSIPNLRAALQVVVPAPAGTDWKGLLASQQGELSSPATRRAAQSGHT